DRIISATEMILSLSARFTAPAGSCVTETDDDGSTTETILPLSARFTAPAGSGATETAPEDSATLSGSRLSVTVTSAPSPTSATAPITLPVATAEPPASLAAVPTTRRSPEASPEAVTALSAAPVTTGAATMRALPAIVQFRPVVSVKAVVPSASWVKSAAATRLPSIPSRTSAAHTRPTNGSEAPALYAPTVRGAVPGWILVVPPWVTGLPSCVHGPAMPGAV